MLRLAITVFGCATFALGQQRPDVVLNGVITLADHGRYKEIPFTVPEGVARLTVEFAYTGREQTKARLSAQLRHPVQLSEPPIRRLDAQHQRHGPRL